MNERMLEVLEGIRSELELQNNLMAYDMTENKDNSIYDIEQKIKMGMYKDLRQKKKKKNDVKSSSGLESNSNDTHRRKQEDTGIIERKKYR